MTCHTETRKKKNQFKRILFQGKLRHKNLWISPIFYLRDEFLSLNTVNVSRHIKGADDIENIISASKSNTIEIFTS